ncbi:hypothetical protein PSCLAVI8L_250019 [Pseudoclavibacter sp. 8L]|nr:hypothetical protein PSCLAVI8L_250019 [Pseudoclavibacter sp. 8L]
MTVAYVVGFHITSNDFQCPLG